MQYNSFFRESKKNLQFLVNFEDLTNLAILSGNFKDLKRGNNTAKVVIFHHNSVGD